MRGGIHSTVQSVCTRGYRYMYTWKWLTYVCKGGGGYLLQLGKMCKVIREDVKIHNHWLQPKCYSIQQLYSCSILVGCSWLLNMGDAA